MSDVNKQIQELIAFLEVLREDEPEALARVVPELGQMLEAEKVLAFGVRVEDGNASLSFAHATGQQFTSKLAMAFNRLLALGKAPLLFNPAKPELSQRNIALALPPALQVPSSGLWVKKGDRGRPIHVSLNPQILNEKDREAAAQLFRAAGISEDYVLRTLICDGPSLLAWLGIFQPSLPTERQREILMAFLPALQRRLKVERLVGSFAGSATALNLVLEKLASPAFLITASGGIVYANSAGRELVNADWPALERSLRKSLSSRSADSSFDLTQLSWTGAPDHYLAVQRALPREHGARLDEAVKQWKLKPQGARVLSRLVQGDANKTIAAKLGCAESTIELHVTQILRHAGVDSRAALIAKFWSRLDGR